MTVPQPEPGHLQRRRGQRAAPVVLGRSAGLHQARRPRAAARPARPTRQGHDHRRTGTQPDPHPQPLSWDLPARTATVSAHLGRHPGRHPDQPPRDGIRDHLGDRRRVSARPARPDRSRWPPGSARTSPSSAAERLRSGWSTGAAARCWTSTAARTADGAKVIQWTWTGARQPAVAAAAQRRRLVPPRPPATAARSLDSPGGSGQGAQLVQWPDTGSDNQWWKLVDAGGGYYRLVNVRNGLVRGRGGRLHGRRRPRDPVARQQAAPTSSGGSTPCDGRVRSGTRRTPPHRPAPRTQTSRTVHKRRDPARSKRSDGIS